MNIRSLLFIVLIPLPLFAQTADTTAAFILHVTDYDTGIVLQYADVRIAELDIAGQTDEDGVVHLTGIPPGIHIISVTCERYTGEVLVIPFEAGDVKEGDLALLRAPVEMEGIEIVDERVNQSLEKKGFYERQKQGIGRFMLKSEIDRKGKILLSEALRGLRGVSIINLEGSNVAVSRRRGQTCPLRIYLNGLRLHGFTGFDGDIIDIDSVPVEDVAGIEVYIGPSEIPIQYNQFNVCGVLLIWTR